MRNRLTIIPPFFSIDSFIIHTSFICSHVCDHLYFSPIDTNKKGIWQYGRFKTNKNNLFHHLCFTLCVRNGKKDSISSHYANHSL